jgi:hypothetical protein
MKALVALLMMSAPAWGQTCTIVTNGTVKVFQHELAHCNGWSHKPFQRGVNPPPEYVHHYDGELVVYLTGDFYSSMSDTIDYAQQDTKFIMDFDRTVPGLCKQFWRERGIPYDASVVDEIVGCSVK